MLEILTSLFIALAVYAYVGYPILLAGIAATWQVFDDLRFVLTKQERRLSHLQPRQPEHWPDVAILISAYNEERHLRQRMDNLLSLDYPADRLHLYIGSDGSQDATAQILASYQDPRLHAHIVANNRGKATMLNDLVAQTTAPILVFSDANTFFDQHAIKLLVAAFSNAQIGAVSGELRLYSQGVANQDGLYWRMEQTLKYWEARIGGLLGCNGAIYAIRREYWRPLKANTICDDFCIGMNVAAQGKKLAYQPAAWAQEEMPPDLSDEYHRRLRIGIGNFQALFRHPEYFWRTSWGTRFAYVSHKVLRWLTPLLLVCALAGSFWLGQSQPMWFILACLQLGSYTLGALLYRLSEAGFKLPTVVRLPAYLFALNWAFLVAFWQYVHGRYSGSWRRSTR